MTDSSVAEANGNLVVNKTLEVHGFGVGADYSRQGTYFGWNGICCLGETDFINNQGGAAGPNIGGYMFWNILPDGSSRTLLMLVDAYARAAFGGTNSPQNSVTVRGGITVDRDDQNTGNPFINYYSSYGLTFGDASGEGIASARVQGSPNENGLDFFTGYSKRLSITQGGAVGIGTTAPTARLEVTGDVQISNGGTLKFPDGTVQSTSPLLNGNLVAGTNVSLGRITIGAPAPDGNGTPSQGIVFADTTNSGGTPWTHASIYSEGSVGYNGNLIFATDGDGQNNNNPTERMRIDSAGNVGIGTPTPAARLDVNGSVKIRSGALTFSDGSSLSSAVALAGLGSTNGLGLAISGTNLDQNAGGPSALAGVQNSWKMLLGWNRSGGAGEQDFVAARAANLTGGFAFYDLDPGGTTTQLASLDRGGLSLTGNLGLSNGAHVNYPDGTQQSTAWTGTLTGGDYAEAVDVTGSRQDFEPGDLLVIDSSHAGNFLKSSQPYSTLVGGVYATRPGVTGRRQARDRPSDGEVPMAMVGIVPTKVSAENGPVHVGDLLVSSSAAGYAMKGTERSQLTGAILGKALGNLESGRGVIEVLISLQ